MDLKETLAQFNLSKKEAAIYVAALELGASTATAIAKKAGVQRTHFYDLSEKLVKEGFLKQVNTEKKRLFSPTEPDMLVELQEERLIKLKKIIPQFKAIYNTVGQKPKIFYYEGRAGIDQINDDTLRYKGEVVAFTTPRFVSTYNKKLSEDYIKRRVAVGNRTHVIGEHSPEILDLKKRDANELRETRIVSRDVFCSEVEIGIYGNKVFIIDYKEEFGFIIEGSEIAKAMKMIFEIVWGMWKTQKSVEIE